MKIEFWSNGSAGFYSTIRDGQGRAWDVLGIKVEGEWQYHSSKETFDLTSGVEAPEAVRQFALHTQQEKDRNARPPRPIDEPMLLIV